MHSHTEGNHDPISGDQTGGAIAKVAGVTIIGDADAVAAARAALESRPQPAYPDELTPELREVLGFMCFQCISIAQAMRLAGIDVKKRAEDEQANVLHWMVKLVLRHGADWRKEGVKDIEAWRARAQERAAASEGTPA